MTSPRSPDRAASRLALKRPVELAWRARDGENPPIADASRPGASIAAGTARAAPPAATPALPAAHGKSEQVVRANALDPALANRLADDIIRRIDRRARIERERRGLI